MNSHRTISWENGNLLSNLKIFLCLLAINLYKEKSVDNWVVLGLQLDQAGSVYGLSKPEPKLSQINRTQAQLKFYL